jgi:hypothetical protein
MKIVLKRFIPLVGAFRVWRDGGDVAHRRPAQPASCGIARAFKEGIDALAEQDWDVLFLDHDLGDFQESAARS